MPRSLFFVCKLINALKQQSSTFLAPGTWWKTILPWIGEWGVVSGWFKSILFIVHFLLLHQFHLSHQALDLGGWRPLLWRTSSWKTNHILFCGPWLFWRQWPSLTHRQIDPMLLSEASDPQNQSQKSLTFAVLKKCSLLKGTLQKAVMLGKESLTPNLCVINWLFS